MSQNLKFRLYICLLILFISKPSFAQSTKGITGIKDTSYTLASAYAGTIKTHPFIKMPAMLSTSSVESKKNIVFAKIGNRTLLSMCSPIGI